MQKSWRNAAGHQTISIVTRKSKYGECDLAHTYHQGEMVKRWFRQTADQEGRTISGFDAGGHAGPYGPEGARRK
jgi:hypothetical protein